MRQLSQKGFLVEKQHSLQKKGVESYTKDLDTDGSVFVAYSDIDSRERLVVYTDKKTALLYVGWGVILIGLMNGLLSLQATFERVALSMTAISILGGLIILFYQKYQNKFYLVPLDDGRSLPIIYDNPNLAEVELFIDDIYEARRLDYRKRYFRIEESSDKETEIMRMKWLLREKIINKSEYELMIDAINTQFM